MFARFKILGETVPSTRHHTAGGLHKGPASENVFNLSFLIGQPAALHVLLFGRTCSFI
jgi:hypothetical protein